VIKVVGLKNEEDDDDEEVGDVQSVATEC